VIGKNTAARYSKDIAQILALEKPEAYTSHGLKRTSATWCADDGLSVMQLKGHTGHKSDSSAQEYVDASIIQKKIAASAVSVESTTSLKRSCSSTNDPDGKRATSVTFNFAGATLNIGGSFQVFGPMNEQQPSTSSSSSSETSSSSTSSVTSNEK
jgi:hypothetical protein